MLELSSIDLTKYFFDGMSAAFEPLKPYIVGAIASLIVIGVLKWILHGIYDFICFEVSARERRKAHKKIDNTVDFISNIADLLSNLKSNNKRK